ncbi:hypothetical protein QOZ80_5BG0453750 [Eleusine coracana subsp. coracana]|nr:hypothetical protein QOZ80_5BG0453750 [Eleusine coracana subsp. coracana]
MATTTTKQQQRITRVDDDEVQHGQLVDCFCERIVDDRDEGHGVVDVATEAVMMSSKRVMSRLAVEGGAAAGNNNNAGGGGSAVVRPSSPSAKQAAEGRGTTLPPPHAWLAIEDTKKKQEHIISDAEEQWARLLRSSNGNRQHHHHHHHQNHRRSSFSVVRRERAAREAWLDRAWEMKRSWHQRNGGAPDADTPVVVVVGGGNHHHHHSSNNKEQQPSSPTAAAAMAASEMMMGGGGGVAMDVEEVRACRDLGLELPSDCTVEIQCYGLSGDSSPTHTNGSGSGADSPCAGGVSSPAGGADPMDVKARLKAWAQAVALTSTTQLGS